MSVSHIGHILYRLAYPSLFVKGIHVKLSSTSSLPCHVSSSRRVGVCLKTYTCSFNVCTKKRLSCCFILQHAMSLLWIDGSLFKAGVDLYSLSSLIVLVALAAISEDKSSKFSLRKDAPRVPAGVPSPSPSPRHSKIYIPQPLPSFSFFCYNA